MHITTKNGSQYSIYVDSATGLIRVEGTPVELVVTDLLNMVLGERLVIKGYLINPITLAPRMSLGKFSYTTSSIIKIQP